MPGSPPPLKSVGANGRGLLATLKVVCGKVGGVGAPAIAAPVPRLPESNERVTGKRSPTKKVAGLPSCARRRTWRPLRTSDNASEKSAATLGKVSRKVDLPPPTTTSGGTSDVRPPAPPAVPKRPAINAVSAARSFAWRSWFGRLVLLGIRREVEGGERASLRAVCVSTDSRSV